MTLTLHSEPVEVGTATAGEDGSFTATVTVPAATEAGEHTLVAASASPSITASAPLTVTPAPAAPTQEPSAAPSPSASAAPTPDQGGTGGLARTGSDAVLAGVVAALAAGAGTAFVRRSRRAKA